MSYCMSYPALLTVSVVLLSTIDQMIVLVFIIQAIEKNPSLNKKIFFYWRHKELINNQNSIKIITSTVYVSSMFFCNYLQAVCALPMFPCSYNQSWF